MLLLMDCIDSGIKEKKLLELSSMLLHYNHTALCLCHLSQYVSAFESVRDQISIAVLSTSSRFVDYLSKEKSIPTLSLYSSRCCCSSYMRVMYRVLWHASTFSMLSYMQTLNWSQTDLWCHGTSLNGAIVCAYLMINISLSIPYFNSAGEEVDLKALHYQQSWLTLNATCIIFTDQTINSISHLSKGKSRIRRHGQVINRK